MSYHPDKTGRGDQDSVFLAIQEAHDNLVNPEKRRAYDSQNEFDDKIPTGNEKPARFYKLYGDCFVLNGRFAVKTPVPELGDDDTPIEEVHEVLLFVVWAPCGCSCRLRALQQRGHALSSTAHLVKHFFVCRIAAAPRCTHFTTTGRSSSRGATSSFQRSGSTTQTKPTAAKRSAG